MYLRYMTIAFAANGMGIFGLRVLTGAGVRHTDVFQYLTIWYLAGALLSAFAYFSKARRPFSREIFIGGAMALSSVCGQLSMAGALSGGLPGYMVFPVATGGGLLLVVAVGIGLFRERMGMPGYLGIGVGTVALILLALP
jgi:multidrug transporter EmrE-like cation transporter